MRDFADLASFFPAHIERLRRRYAAALEDSGWDAVVIHSGTPKKKCDVDDATWPLRPTPAFAHWLPLAEADCALVLRGDDRPVLYRPSGEDFWHGTRPPVSSYFWRHFEVREVGDGDAIGAALPPNLRLAFLGDDVDRAAAWQLEKEAHNPADLVTALDQVRTIKSDYERACIGAANAVAARGHHAVAEAFAKDHLSEFELHLLYLGATGQDDPETPYKNIVALGEHAAVLHHAHYGKTRPPDGSPQSLLIDAGASSMGYASDVTRTYLKGTGSEALFFAELIQRMGVLQEKICAEIAPGRNYEELHDRAHELLAAVLRDLGIAGASEEELVESGATRAFFPHGLGHLLGLQVHDVGGRPADPRPENRFLRTTRAIEVGQVFTVEPGCYFIDSLLAPFRKPTGPGIDWKAVDRLRPFGGVRVEDDMAVLEDRVENLTRTNWNPAAPTAQRSAR